jgi:phage terminase Nu1 subunit (DNA packaging protein)
MKVNKRQLADVMCVSERTLTEWQDEGLPIARKGVRGEENEYDTGIVIAWHVQRSLTRAGKAESQRDREARLRGDMLEIELAKERHSLVPANEVKPVWESRVLAAAAFMMSRQSRLAGILEATPGIEAKRELLKKEDAAFLEKLGTDGERMQAVVQSMLAKLTADDVNAFLRNLAGDNEQRTDGSAPGSMDAADPPEEDPAQ